MNDEKPKWYLNLNLNERRIIDVFVETKAQYILSRPVLENKLVRTGLMNQSTLTDRLKYLVDHGHIGKIVGRKGAVFYGPRFLIEQILKDPLLKGATDAFVGTCPPKKAVSFISIKRKPEVISDKQMTGFLIQAAITTEKSWKASKKEKEREYKRLRRLRRKLCSKVEKREHSL
jgi:hypothetical protein